MLRLGEIEVQFQSTYKLASSHYESNIFKLPEYSKVFNTNDLNIRSEM